MNRHPHWDNLADRRQTYIQDLKLTVLLFLLDFRRRQNRSHFKNRNDGQEPDEEEQQRKKQTDRSQEH